MLSLELLRPWPKTTRGAASVPAGNRAGQAGTAAVSGTATSACRSASRVTTVAGLARSSASVGRSAPVVLSMASMLLKVTS